MDNAIKYGYTFEIIQGYQFDKANLFKDYVNKMYNLRMEYAKGTPMNLIAKLLMNSLYGKFGMRDERTKVEIFDCSTDEGHKAMKDAVDFYQISIKDYVELGDNFICIVRD
jgi:hypothetical protein